MDKYAKMIGAAQGGLTSAAAVTAMAIAGIQLIPDNARTDVPWWGYLLIFFLAAVICTLFPALSTYLAPANKPADLPTKVDVPVNIPVEIAKAVETVKVAAAPAPAFPAGG